MFSKENSSFWQGILTSIDKKNKFKNRITKIGVSDSGKPSNFQLILTGNFQEFGRDLENIIDNFLRFESKDLKFEKMETAILSQTLSSNSYTLEIAETIAIRILEYAEEASLTIDCSIKKDTNFIQM